MNRLLPGGLPALLQRHMVWLCGCKRCVYACCAVLHRPVLPCPAATLAVAVALGVRRIMRTEPPTPPSSTSTPSAQSQVHEAGLVALSAAAAVWEASLVHARGEPVF